MKLYFRNEDSDVCHPKEYFIDEMAHELKSEMQVLEAEKEKITDVFWCKVYDFCGQKGPAYENCGNGCDGYEPRNGRSGCCKHYTRTLYTPGKQITLKLKK